MIQVVLFKQKFALLSNNKVFFILLDCTVTSAVGLVQELYKYPIIGKKLYVRRDSVMTTKARAKKEDSLQVRARVEPQWSRLLSGGAASATAELLTLPIDITKTMIKHEGLSALWNGATPALLRQVSYTSICMVLYEPLRNTFGASVHHCANGEVSFMNKFLAGGCAGAIGISIANPVDVIKVRMQANRSGKLYSGVGDAFSVIYKREGFRGFLRGMSPNIKRGFVVNAAELGTYDHSKELLISSGLLKEGVLAHTGASCVAGLAGASASNPIDVVKTRLMSQPTDVKGKGLLYKGMIDCMHKTFLEGGAGAFYKGFIPNWMRKAPWCIVFFVTYEEIRSMLTPSNDRF
ncbi:mitochondrial substrate carrier family protein [Plasmopara halstedii]|uniref:Mitochondrial substrate carrier family protein n=1 Tax=Plasmopara halstedii TaxID=4781 RepID=A0A0P1ARI0_PLAHL|nr:mitochondrial substrate carrier family protein [Plasmopara halstedii]CEG43537.1 mitochondrial substrate carrier family protein [Plasmopara halstedii]|eukprot:XP_024579906.1 mitochondrial substrate carrier family protein [Plasmopara halstedii]